MDITDFITQALNLVLVSPANPLQNLGISGFLFDVLDDEEVNLDSEITDHYVENNSAIQDHVALRPIKYTVRGFVGELTSNIQGISALAQSIVERVTLIADLLPSITTEAQQAYDNLSSISQATALIADASNLYSVFSNSNISNLKQQTAFNYFRALRDSRTIVSVQTPFGNFSKMLIESVRAMQPGESKYVGDFSVTMKELRTVTTQALTGTTMYDLLAQAQGRLQEQSQTKDQGSTSGNDTTVGPITSFANWIFS